MKHIKSLNEEFVNAYEERVIELQQTPLVKIKWPKFRIITDGDEYFSRIFKMIELANTHIFVFSYTFDDSIVALRVLDSLIDALKRGVKVYLLLENLIIMPKPENLKKFTDQGGVIIQRNKYKGFKEFINRKYFQRDHVKIIIADGSFIIGSANLSEAYGHKRYGNSFFYDLNCYGENCLINEFADFLETYCWSLRYSEVVKAPLFYQTINQYRALYKDINVKNVKVNLYASSPPRNMLLQNRILEDIEEAENKIWIVNAYYYQIKAVEDALIRAAKRGVDVQIITAQKRDIPVYKDMLNSILFENLLENGIKVYQYRPPGYLHAKSFAIDDQILNLGSFNLDKWSWYNNVEANIYFMGGQKQIENFNTIFENFKLKSEEIHSKAEYTKFSKKFKNMFWERFFLSICDQLMNRAIISINGDMNYSIFIKMQNSMSWKSYEYAQSDRLRKASGLVGIVSLNEIKNHVKK